MNADNIVKAVLDILYINNAIVEVTLVDKNTIRTLNKLRRKIDKVTDVLSFPAEFTNPETGKKILGDIILCDEVIKEQAKEYGHSYEREFSYLTVHGILHLLGYDHMNEEDKKIMRAKEEELLGKL